MALGYRLPGTVITEVTEPQSVNISSSQRTPCFIGTASENVKVKYEEVVRSSSGLIDELAHTADGIASIIAVESQRGLGDFTEGTHFNLTDDSIEWTSSGYLTAGATYFVTYKYVRPDSDYKYKEFTNFEDVYDDLGEDIPDHTLVMIAKLALQYYNVPKIAVYQVPSTETTDSYSTALTAIKYRNVQTVCALTSTSNVQTLLRTHVKERSLPDNGRYRIAWMGASVGTPVGDEDTPESLRGKAVALRDERVIFINATRATYYYTDEDTKEEKSTTVDGSFIAAALAAYRDAFSYPATTLLNRVIPGLELADDDYDDYYSEYQLELCGGSSLFLCAPTPGGIKVMDDLTTDNSTVERNNINIITAKDYVATDVAIQMDRTFKGRLITDRASYASTVKAYLYMMFNAYKQNRVIESIGTIKVNLPTNRRDTVNIYYGYYAIYTHKYTVGEYALQV